MVSPLRAFQPNNMHLKIPSWRHVSQLTSCLDFAVMNPYTSIALHLPPNRSICFLLITDRETRDN